MTAHTPGPWRVNGFGNISCQFLLAELGGMYPEKAANAALIAAAPELLEALELLIALPVQYNNNRIEIDCGSHGEAMAIVRKARAAVAKATGGAA
jgi:hypothetical protein